MKPARARSTSAELIGFAPARRLGVRDGDDAIERGINGASALQPAQRVVAQNSPCARFGCPRSQRCCACRPRVFPTPITGGTCAGSAASFNGRRWLEGVFVEHEGNQVGQRIGFAAATRCEASHRESIEDRLVAHVSPGAIALRAWPTTCPRKQCVPGCDGANGEPMCLRARGFKTRARPRLSARLCPPPAHGWQSDVVARRGRRPDGKPRGDGVDMKAVRWVRLSLQTGRRIEAETSRDFGLQRLCSSTSIIQFRVQDGI